MDVDESSDCCVFAFLPLDGVCESRIYRILWMCVCVCASHGKKAREEGKISKSRTVMGGRQEEGEKEMIAVHGSEVRFDAKRDTREQRKSTQSAAADTAAAAPKKSKVQENRKKGKRGERRPPPATECSPFAEFAAHATVRNGCAAVLYATDASLLPVPQHRERGEADGHREEESANRASDEKKREREEEK